MRIAEVVAEAGTCSRLQVGALLVYARRIISTGYNGAPAGMDHCYHQEGDERPCERAVHAESNAIAFAAKNGIKTEGATLYVTDSPCITCARLLINAGIKEVVFGREYRDNSGLAELLNAGCGIAGPYGPELSSVQAFAGDRTYLHPGQYAYPQVEGPGPTGKGPNSW